MKRIISMILVIVFCVMTLLVSTKNTYAFPGNYFWFPKGMHVRIYHPSSGLYLGIEPEGNEVDGARIQLQRYEEGNQNQIFYLKPISKDSNGRIQYQIRVHGESDMIIEIRNASHDDFAEAAQWTEHNGDCAKWYFFTQDNRNGCDSATCCIKNVESGKMLNVCRNEAYEGNNLIQYHEDGTQAEVFYIYSVEDDIIGAMWSRDWSDNTPGLYWSIKDDTPENRRKYFTPINVYSNGYIGHPVVYQNNLGFLATVIWADNNLQKKLLQLHNPPKDAMTRISEALGGVGREWAIDTFFAWTPLGAIPTGDVEGIISTIMASQSEQQWYRIEKAFEEHSKVRIEIYYMFNAGSWGVNCQPIVNDEVDTYWNGNKSSITNKVIDYWGNEVNGSVEYFFR